MKYIELRKWMKDFTVFSLDDIRLIEEDFDRRRLYEWTEKGYIRKIRDGYYIFSDLDLNESVLFEVANRIYKPSYISLEMAFQWYDFITEGVYSTTSVTTRKTADFETVIADFNYRKIKSDYYFGYRIIEYPNGVFKLAEPEKCILDYLYLSPSVSEKKDFRILRFKKESLKENIDFDKLKEYCEVFDKKKLSNRVNSFMEYVND